ncbi:MAG: alanine racemase [Oscillospiraceae bacterium]|jgi:alanine racemase|nr:alanine racemase [Oscillospiraceae bacterium]
MRNTRLIINLDAIARNVRALRAVDPSAPMMAVVKANAYGHGGVETARIALANGCAALGVAIAEEGVLLRRSGVAAPILIMGAPDPAAIDDVIINRLTQTIFLPEHAAMLDKAASRVGAAALVHLKADTGMHRIGVSGGGMESLADAVSGFGGIRVTGVFTHLAAADSTEPDDMDYTRAQIESFERIAAAMKARFGPIIAHAANSAGYLAWPRSRMDMSRVGIAMYGAPPIPAAASLPPVGERLLPAMRWVTQASSVREIPAGSCVGYGRAFTSARATRVMTIPVGYADGFSRALSNKGYVLTRGKRAPIIGRVCMDQTMADVTDIPGAEVGDEVVLLGSQGGESITADDIAGWAGTISYEIFCAVSPRVPRAVIPAETC